MIDCLQRRGASCTTRALATLLAALSLALVGPARARAGGKVEYNRDVRPILSENCFACHGPDRAARKAELRLDVRDSALAKGAIVPGKPDESELAARITSDDPLQKMPPPKSTKKLTPAQVETLERWLAEGAEYEPHWSYVRPHRPEVPAVNDRGWVRNPIDAFILSVLEARGIAPSHEADRRALLRRLSLDLIGLPPTPEEVRAFLADTDPHAYEKQVDRLLASPHFGERMAVPWLDVVRFSDTVGYHGDQNQRIFPYRDYVIDAFNRNMPFDQFTTEQLAGDLLPNATDSQRVATGYNRLNMMTREGGAQPKEYLAKYAGDRVRTFAATWLGSTLGCAECHDHKYDPFLTRDFYSLAAFFADIKQWGVYADYQYTPNPDLKGWTNDHPFPPEIEVPSAYLARRQARIDGQIEGVLRESAARLLADAREPEALEAWRQQAVDLLACQADGWRVPEFELAGSKPDEPMDVQDDSSVLVTRTAKKGAAHRLVLRPGAGWVASIRLELLPHESLKGNVLRDGAESTLIRLGAAVRPSSGKEKPLGFAGADADRKEPRYANGDEILGITSGWKTLPEARQERQAGVWVLEKPVCLEKEDSLVVTVRGEKLGRFRVAVSPFAFELPEKPSLCASDREALASRPDSRTSKQAARLRRMYLLATGWDGPALARYRALWQQRLECRNARAYTMVVEAHPPRVTRVLPRGNWQDESGAVVDPAVPHFLPQPDNTEGRRLTRLDLARWLVDPDNPLTARVFVNRLWKQYFGTGLSSTVDDLGAQGDWPSHPALLDWLAVEFRERGWNVKHMVRLLVTSAAYRQDARLRPELHELDPNNRLVASQSPRRLEAEFVRDNALAIAGLLNPEIGGPSVFPYQPPGYYANLQFPDRDYVASTDERQYRRGLYMHWQRTFLHPMLANFDAPSREECAAGRTVANSPQQALTLLNDPTFVEAARVLARRLVESGPADDAARLDRLFEQALARPAKPAERQALLAFLGAQREAYARCPDDAGKLLHVGLAPAPAPAADSHSANLPELAAWTSVCRVVLNLHETITRY